MALTIVRNLASASITRHLTDVTRARAQSFNRLSSGLRIAKAADDAAGLSIAASLRFDTRIALAAIRNTNEGIAVLNTAEGGASSQLIALHRMRDLAVQGMNGTLSLEQRCALHKEFISLGREVSRIARTTKFNGFELLVHRDEHIRLQVSFSGDSANMIAFRGLETTAYNLGLSNDPDVDDITTSLTSQNASRVAKNYVDYAIDKLQQERTKLAEVQSRLEFAVGDSSIKAENYASAESTIASTDIPEELAQQAKLDILQQAIVAALAHSNLQPQMVLKLLE